MPNLVIGMSLQFAYFNENGSMYLGNNAIRLKKDICTFFEERKKLGDKIILTREIHGVNDNFFKGCISCSMVGTKDIEIVEAFKYYTSFIINTIRYNAFYYTPLETEIKKMTFDKVFLVGVETHTNILFTAEELRNRNYDVVIPKNLVLSKEEYMHILGINILCNTLSVEMS